VPLWLGGLGRGFDVDLYARPRALVGPVAVALLVPLGLGALVRWLRPGWAQRLHDPLVLLLRVALVAILVGALVTGWPRLRVLGGWLVPALLLHLVAAGLAGNVAGAPRLDDRVTLTRVAALGNPMLALFVAHHGYAELRLMPALVACAALRTLLFLPYLQWRRWAQAHQPPQTLS
jgi:BASS family bile acid:Na+ symporter